MYFMTREIAKIQIALSMTPRQNDTILYPRIVKIVRTVPIDTSQIRREKDPDRDSSAHASSSPWSRILFAAGQSGTPRRAAFQT
jgi:hypothetical protein